MDLEEYRDIVEMRNSTCKESISIMKEKPDMIYPEAWEEAMKELFGSYFPMIQHNNSQELDEIIESKAKSELNPELRVDFYDSEQLMAILAAKRMGVEDIEEYVNIFQTPEQIRFLALASLMKIDVTPYALDLKFDPDVEMKKLLEQQG